MPVRPDQVTAARCRSARSIHSRLRAWVAASTTGGATPARVRLRPPARAKTPAIARAQPREAELRTRRLKVIADPRAEPQELGGHHRTDRVHPGVIGVGVAAAVAMEPRHRVGAAALQRATQHIARHVSMVTLRRHHRRGDEQTSRPSPGLLQGLTYRTGLGVDASVAGEPMGRTVGPSADSTPPARSAARRARFVRRSRVRRATISTAPQVPAPSGCPNCVHKT